METDLDGIINSHERSKNAKSRIKSSLHSQDSRQTEKDIEEHLAEIKHTETSVPLPSPTSRRSGICGLGYTPRRSLKTLLLSCQKSKFDTSHNLQVRRASDEAERILDSNRNMALKRSSSVPHKVSYPIHDAVRNNDFKELGKLFKKKKRIDVDLKDEEGFSALHRAAQIGFTEAVEFLVSHGANVNLKSKNNLAPLYFAVQSGNFDCAAFLIDHGADDGEIKDGFSDSKGPEFLGKSRFSRTRMSVHN
eukprot:Seg68.7 transcript_id=Seg68.7/GoldUCD/mRNA.D3Y31 product=Ankyrin-3 protein_id=Seg68.7/GoldUCD/D3Y31